MTTSNDDHLVEIEVKLTYHERTLDALHGALVDKEQRITALEETVRRLEKAIGILAQRGPGGDVVAGAHPEDDPVPRSG